MKFADACLRGLRGDAGIVECAFVASQVSNFFLIKFEFFFFFLFLFFLNLTKSYLSNVMMTTKQVTELPFFASKVRLGRAGAEEVYQLGLLNEYERYILLRSSRDYFAALRLRS